MKKERKKEGQSPADGANMPLTANIDKSINHVIAPVTSAALDNEGIDPRHGNGTVPDGFVERVGIHAQYGVSPRQTIANAFDARTGVYRYGNQVLEVPRDQYEECVKLFKVRISAGKVRGVTNPADAGCMVQKGRVTYRQARNIARSGRIGSLTYDAGTQMVAVKYVFGISFAIQFAALVWNGASQRDALRVSAIGSMSASGKTFVAGVVTSQLLRLKAAGPGIGASVIALNALHKTPIGKGIIDAIASVTMHKALGGAAAVSRVARLLRTNFITGAVVTGSERRPRRL